MHSPKSAVTVGSMHAKQLARQPGTGPGLRLVAMTVPGAPETAVVVTAARLWERGRSVYESTDRTVVGGQHSCLSPKPIPAASTQILTLSGCT